MKRSILVIAAVLVAVISLFAQINTEKLYKNEKEKEELVTAILQDKELSGELTEKLMTDMDCCKDMMNSEKEGKKSCSMMGMMEMKDMKNCPMMSKEGK